MPKTLDVAIFFVGAAFFLLGVIGEVEAFNINAGTTNIYARIVFAILGLWFMYVPIMHWQYEKEQKRLRDMSEMWEKIQQRNNR